MKVKKIVVLFVTLGTVAPCLGHQPPEALLGTFRNVSPQEPPTGNEPNVSVKIHPKDQKQSVEPQKSSRAQRLARRFMDFFKRRRD